MATPETESPYLQSLQGKHRGVRILTLDGGGMKGYFELTMLEEIEKRTKSSVCTNGFLFRFSSDFKFCYNFFQDLDLFAYL